MHQCTLKWIGHIFINMFLITFKGHFVSVSLTVHPNKQPLRNLVSVRLAADIWKDSLLWSKNCHTRCQGAEVKMFPVQICNFATFNLLSHQMLICKGQSFVQENVWLFLFYFQA